MLVVFHILQFISPCQQIYSTMTVFDNSCMLRVCLNMVSCNEKAWFFNSIQKKLSLYFPKICIYKLTFITEFVIIIQSLTPSCAIITVKLAVHISWSPLNHWPDHLCWNMLSYSGLPTRLHSHHSRLPGESHMSEHPLFSPVVSQWLCNQMQSAWDVAAVRLLTFQS